MDPELNTKIDRYHAELCQRMDLFQKRLDGLDLNGSAAILRTFGNWLMDNPDFMNRTADHLRREIEKEQALTWLSEALHLKTIMKVGLWIITAVCSGFALAIGGGLLHLPIPDFLHHVP